MLNVTDDSAVVSRHQCTIVDVMWISQSMDINCLWYGIVMERSPDLSKIAHLTYPLVYGNSSGADPVEISLRFLVWEDLLDDRLSYFNTRM